MKTEIILIAALIIIFIAAVVLGAIGCFNAVADRKNNEAALEQEAEQIELAKQEIVSEYGFDPILWIGAEKIDNLDGRDDFYIFTCLVDEGELVEYRFAITIREVDGEVDVDTWQIRR